MTVIRNISYHWPNQYSLHYDIDFLGLDKFASNSLRKLHKKQKGGKNIFLMI